MSPNRMHNIILVLCCTGLLALPAEAKKWRTYENCKLIEIPSNDGDSFHVRCKRRRYLFRLYFVDAPETDDSIPDRVKEQAAYWGIDEKSAIELGKQARKFTAEFLKDGFTAYSKLQDARGRSEKDRDYAVIRVGDTDLGEELVRNGLARVFGQGMDLWDGTSERQVWWRLKNAEHEAKQNKRGGWAGFAPTTLLDRFQQMNQPEELAEQDLVLPQTIAVYSLGDATRQVGLLQKGAEVRVLGAGSPTMVRIRFTTSEGKTYEAQCRRADLGL